MSHAAAARSAWYMALKGGKGMRLLPADPGIGPAAAAAAVSRQAWLLPSRQLLRWAGLTGGSSRSAAAAAAAVGTGSSGGSSSSGAKPKAVAERIGFIGAGQMGEALIRGFIKARVSTPGKICCSVRDLDRQDALERIGIGSIFGDATEGGSEEVARFARIIVLCTKPQAMPEVLESLAPHITPDHLVVSVAAGMTLATLEQALGESARVVRVMPNTPSLVQSGASAFCLGRNATQQDADVVETLFCSVGFCIQVQEKQMDAVTGLSGSGPAFVYLMIEALADGGVAAGLPRDTALALAAKTVAGAAQMVFSDDETSVLGLVHPGVLKDRVASPAGTTIEGLAELESSGVRGAFIRAVKRAAARSKELAG
ncbi:hypothetical protein ABPG77_003908 [Micractinium sp. CCAP 211/92]